MKRLSSVLLSFALLSPVPSAFAQPLVSPSTSHDEFTLAELIAVLNELLLQLNAHLQANTTSTVTTSSVPTVPTTPPVSTTPPVTTPPTNSTSSGPTISIDGNSATGSIGIYDYGMWIKPNNFGGTSSGAILTYRHNEFNVDYAERDFPTLDIYGSVTYQRDDGFHGFYKHSNGNSGTITSDVQLSLRLANTKGNAYIHDFKIGVRNPIVIEGQNLGSIDGLGYDAWGNYLNSNGEFRDNTKYHAFENVLFSKGSLYGIFSDQFTSEGIPERVAGHIDIKWTDNEWDSTSADPSGYPRGYPMGYYTGENYLRGVFLADDVNYVEYKDN